MQHSFAVVSLPEFHGREPQEGPYVAAKTLRRRIVEVVGHVGHREARILEDPRDVNQPSHGEIALGGWKAGAKETAHERAGKHVQVCGKGPDGRGTRREVKEQLEEAPAVIGHTDKIERENTKREPFDIPCSIRDEHITELAPAR